MRQLKFGGAYDQNLEIDTKYVKNYGVTMHLHQKEQSDQIRYQMQTICSRKAGDFIWEVTLKKTALVINDKVAGFFKQGLDVDFGINVLYPISIKVTLSGVIESITDSSFAAIKERFKKFKKKTLQENSGIHIEHYLFNLEKGIKTKQKLIQHLMFDWFWVLFFAPVYDKNTERLLFPVKTNSPKESYVGTIVEKKELSYYNTRQLLFEGYLSNSYFERYPSKKYYKAGIKLCYDFYANDGIISNISSDQSITEKQNVIQQILVNIDHLPEKDVVESIEEEDQKDSEIKNLTFKDKVLKWWNA